MHRILYIKPTETCNLNCSHCFTSGSNGSKVFFDEIKTADWLYRLVKFEPHVSHIHIEFHGGEPLFNHKTIQKMKTFREIILEQVPTKSISWGVTTNLTYNLTAERVDFLSNHVESIGTSWDNQIRWPTPQLYQLWEENVQKVKSLNKPITLFVSLSRPIIKSDPSEILKMATRLGFEEIDFERITTDGNAQKNPEIFPTNKELDEWYVSLYEVYQKNFYNKIKIRNIDNLVDFFKYRSRAGTHCRDCEQKIFTVNATGTIGGCPNTAPTQHYGHIDMEMAQLFSRPERSCRIAKEIIRPKECLTCEVSHACGGGCHLLEWDEHCPGPKSLLKKLNNQFKEQSKQNITQLAGA